MMKIPRSLDCDIALMKSRPWMAGFALARMDPRRSECTARDGRLALRERIRAQITRPAGMAGFAVHERIRAQKKKKARTGRAFFASDFDLQLREGPPTVGVMVHAIGVAGGQHMTTRGTRVKVHGFGGNWMHAVT
jgi:hypothetical protein